MLPYRSMNLARCLLVALALWMPVASFAASAGVTYADCTASCDDSAPDEAMDSSAEDADMFFAQPLRAPVAPSSVGFHDSAGHRPLAGHLVEPLLPPPNPRA